MPAGTITVTNGSATVTGSGTSFITELKVGDFIGVIVGGTPYTLIVASIASSTQLTIGAAYTGPTAGGLAWYAVPASLMYAVTQQAMNDMGKILRGMIQEKANWQQVFSGTGNVTVTLPDGSQYTGPAWNNITSSLSGKLTASSNLSDLTSPGDARKNIGIGPDNALFISAIELSGATPYIDFHYGKSTADYTCRLINSAAGTLEIATPTDGNGRVRVNGGYQCRGGLAGSYNINSFNFFWNTGNALEAWVDTLKIGNVTVSSTSDKGLKKDIVYREDSTKALEEVLQWRPADFKMKARGIIPETPDQLGFIANDLVKVSPECVSGKGLPDDFDIEADPNNGDAYSLNQVPMIAKLTQAIHAQQKIIDSQSEIIKAMGVRLKDLDGLDG